MQISNNLKINNRLNYHVSVIGKVNPDMREYSSMPNCCPAYFSPSFTAMKKREFVGVDNLVVEKYKAPIQKFKSHEDFDAWAREKCDEVLSKDFAGRKMDTESQRRHALFDWENYLNIENEEYTPSEKLLIFDGITRDCEAKNEYIPPELHKGVLALTIKNLREELKVNPSKKEYNFGKSYQRNLRERLTGTKKTGWIIIPSKENDPEHYKDNAENLRVLSYKTWCTKTNKYESYLESGDFHIYLENGEPKIGIKFLGDEIDEIQGEKNIFRIPYGYYDICKNHIDEGGYILSDDMDYYLKKAKKLEKKYGSLQKALRSGTPEEVFKHLGIKVTKDKSGNMTLSHFGITEKMRENRIDFDDFEINQSVLRNLFKNVKKIEGDANFENLAIENIGDIEEIGGDANFWEVKNIRTLGKLKKVGGKLELGCSGIESLGELEDVGKGAGFYNTVKLKTLGNLKKIGGNANFDGSGIESLGELKEISGNADFNSTKSLKSLGKLKKIKGNASFNYSNIEDLGDLEFIGGDADFDHTEKLKSLGKLKKIGGTFRMLTAKIEDLGELAEIGKFDSFFGNETFEDRQEVLARIKAKYMEKHKVFA